MALKDKLRDLRIAKNLTQEAVAEHLGISSQTVSKWERGLLSPDISLLPKIALLYRCSIDSLFDMDITWGTEHRKEFEAKINKLQSMLDHEGVYQEWMREIELNPDQYSNYTGVMLYVLNHKMFDDKRIEQLFFLAAHAEKHCTNDDIRNEIYRLMLQICAASENPRLKALAPEYYKKLPMLRHSREVYARYVLKDDAFDRQLKHNIFYTIDLTECAIRQLITPEMSAEEKLYYYKKAAALYEIVLDDKYGGFWDVPLLCDYSQIASLLVTLGDPKEAASYIDRILKILEKHLRPRDQKDISGLLNPPSPAKNVPAGQRTVQLLNNMLNDPSLSAFKEPIAAFLKKYTEYGK